MGRPELRIELPADLPSERYEGIADAVSSLLELWGVHEGSASVIAEPVHAADSGRASAAAP
ncbi:hypothetical protein GCM10022243_46870 [Saccharothrix violaceirubra]|uniref:Uncharacterized protein n=1 Tax=Saccharothrix violaceirubra TaxID=413306 RepID=A0A7W7WY26_9PSEU|nr:hypothetical protein [Saccharothrix violaceirubra]MBB4967772.1 hypothetical protein [Saccharothrix violaceirubra]